jgi:hypothetical protein
MAVGSPTLAVPSLGDRPPSSTSAGRSMGKPLPYTASNTPRPGLFNLLVEIFLIACVYLFIFVYLSSKFIYSFRLFYLFSLLFIYIYTCYFYFCMRTCSLF